MHPISTETLLTALHWRYAVKKFDPAKKVPAETWQALEQALVLTPSSIGLQPWKFIIVSDQAMKERLKSAAYQQAQAADCSQLVVFAVHCDLGASHVEKHVARMAEVRGMAPESLAKFAQRAAENLDQARAEGRLDIWQTHQIYIALGNFMTAAALVGIDTCPMEGIEPAKFDEILGLKDTAYTTVVACAAGYRLTEDKYAATKKVRFPAEAVITRI
ncbi:MAG: NAD(P)H-dependent oxidoreductase [Opitutaceae bacterium]|nr:NAD(P)H-dependent oxidoreductase [Opitutaceae bacterium]MBP9914072.1 NAD(P)H-dependent oxidoreductase [Opitutaceae bacterium]